MLTEFFYQWAKVRDEKKGNKVEPPPAQYELAVNEALFFNEMLEHGGKLDIFDERVTPGTWASLRGLWRGEGKFMAEKFVPKDK